MARELASYGFAVMRFDYRGEGESSCLFEECDLLSRLNDIEQATIEFRKRVKLKAIYLLSFRIGALFSLLIADRLGCKDLLFCEPIFDSRKYIENIIRSHIITVKENFPDKFIDSKTIVSKPESGEDVSVYGFHFTGRFIRQIEDVDVKDCVRTFRGNSCIISFGKSSAGNIPVNLKPWFDMLNVSGSCFYLSVHTDFSWLMKKKWTDTISGLAEKVNQWLSFGSKSYGE